MCLLYLNPKILPNFELILIIMNPKIRYILAGLLFVFLVSLLTKSPSHDRKWDPSVEKLPIITNNDNAITINNIRDWKYEGQTITSKDWVKNSFYADELERVWLIVEPFYGWDGIAHTFFSFQFENENNIAFSIEARKELKESYSPISGILDEYELIYQWGTEEDFITRRTDYLNRNVYMYPLKISEKSAQDFFLKLIEETKNINTNPLFYNTVFSNCTNNFANYANEIKPGTIPWHPARVLTGYADDYLHSLGFIDNSQSFDNIKNKAYISTLVKQFNHEKESFSEYLHSRIDKKWL